ncbi:Peptidase inhibitor I78 family [Delftia tsuruhatensis]|uniref:I78 family peptidase inhibitor n=1 Tax=Delftia tsuruhatensis TaxID=180282 RepID=UPI001E6E8BBD|nr:I78 family peptidase inhibitor [Delftia tsuruhatensis]CAB5685560.1 Peptidase inhibitor I78 family [Delftia tsuruhatensis]CAC9690192.1 Peptidase inhibitor I78 family [Delftia tsuruhatensis]
MPNTAPVLHRHRRLAALSLLGTTALIAGCAGMNPLGGTGGGAAQPAPRPVQVCNAAPAQSFVGKNNTSATLEAARKQSGAYMARVLREGQPTTMEFNQERLNLVVDGTGRIVAVRCG